MRFAARDDHVIIDLIVHNDGLVEDDETFFVHLVIPPEAANLGVVLENQPNATVTIRDDDSECSSNALCVQQ